MIYLPIDTNGEDWARVTDYANMRMAQLRMELESVTLSDRERSDIVMRLDELKQLLAAPGETKQDTARRLEQAESGEPMRIY